MRKKVSIVFLIMLIAFSLNAAKVEFPGLTINMDNAAKTDPVLALKILFLLTILAIAPSILLMVTSFTRIVIVLSFLRHALGTMQMPPNQVIIGLALFITFFTMYPTIHKIETDAWTPYTQKEITFQEFNEKTINIVKRFLLLHTGDNELRLFVKYANIPRPSKPQDLPIFVVIPAFMISELKLAFEMAFLIYIPFLIIDTIIASILMSMGMFMLPPVMISMPFKLILFVLANGWYLVVESLIRSYR